MGFKADKPIRNKKDSERSAGSGASGSTPEVLRKYFGDIAEQYGLDPKSGNEAGYSIHRFYDKQFSDEKEHLNKLTRAFFGYDEDPAYIPDAVQPQAGSGVSGVEENDAGTINNIIESTCDARLDEYQKSAVRCALQNEVTVVQGPPGTGKTRTINNLLLCILKQNNNAHMAALSSNHEAIENVIDQIKNSSAKDKYAYLGSRKKRKDFCDTTIWTPTQAAARIIRTGT